MGLKREAARRWVKAFEEITGHILQNPENEAHEVPQEVVQVLVAAKDLLDAKKVDSREEALEAVLARTDAEVTTTRAPDAGRHIHEKLDQLHGLLEALSTSSEPKTHVLQRTLVEEFQEFFVDFMRQHKESMTRTAAAAITNGVNNALVKFETEQMLHAEMLKRNQRDAATAATEQMTTAASQISEQAQRFGAEGTHLSLRLREARGSLSDFQDHMGQTLRAIQRRSLTQPLPLVFATLVGMSAGVGGTILVLSYSWRSIGILFAGATGIVLFAVLVFWAFAAIRLRYF